MKEKIQMIGKKAIIQDQYFQVECEIKDYKSSYGKDRWLVSPIAGKGEAWIENLIFLQ